MAGLVVQGMTNRQIADELVVTVSTVQAHLTRIYAKNGVRSRAQLISTLVTQPERHDDQSVEVPLIARQVDPT